MRWLRTVLRDLVDPHVPLAEVLRETRRKLAEDTEIRKPRVVYALHAEKEKQQELDAYWDAAMSKQAKERERQPQPTKVLQIRSVRS